MVISRKDILYHVRVLSVSMDGIQLYSWFFVMIGKKQKEMKTLLDSTNGDFIPHIVFHVETDSYWT
jgi:hypothetical protein